MAVELNSIAHIQLTVNDPERCIPFWEKLCHFFSMQTLIKGEGIVYCIGSRTGILVRGAPPENRNTPFDQDRAGLHHFCFRARSREDVEAIHEFVVQELGATSVRGPVSAFAARHNFRLLMAQRASSIEHQALQSPTEATARGEHALRLTPDMHMVPR